jgi:elongation factor P--(R)-beta-lysine ligase
LAAQEAVFGSRDRSVRPVERIRAEKAFEIFAGMNMKTALKNDMYEETLAFEIEPRLNKERPVFIYDYPMAHTPI